MREARPLLGDASVIGAGTAFRRPLTNNNGVGCKEAVCIRSESMQDDQWELWLMRYEVHISSPTRTLAVSLGIR